MTNLTSPELPDCVLFLGMESIPPPPAPPGAAGGGILEASWSGWSSKSLSQSSS